MTGLSARNLLFMRQFAAAWPDRAIVKRCVSQLPWGSHVILLQRLDLPVLRLWYAAKAVEPGCSRNLLVAQIHSRFHERERRAWHNIGTTLPPADLVLGSLCFLDGSGSMRNQRMNRRWT